MFRLNCCKAGSILLKLFLLFTGFFSALYLYDLFSAPFGFSGWADNRALFIIRAVAVILFCSALFWTGILLVYICCNQLRVKTRVLGLLFAWVPLLNLGMLLYIIALPTGNTGLKKQNTGSTAPGRDSRSAGRPTRCCWCTASFSVISST